MRSSWPAAYRTNERTTRESLTTTDSGVQPTENTHGAHPAWSTCVARKRRESLECSAAVSSVAIPLLPRGTCRREHTKQQTPQTAGIRPYPEASERGKTPSHRTPDRHPSSTITTATERLDTPATLPASARENPSPNTSAIRLLIPVEEVLWRSHVPHSTTIENAQPNGFTRRRWREWRGCAVRQREGARRPSNRSSRRTPTRRCDPWGCSGGSLRYIPTG
jgi:hypothetical protein